MTSETPPASAGKSAPTTRQVVLRRPVYTLPGRRPQPIGATISVPVAEAAMFVARGIATYVGQKAPDQIPTITPVGADGGEADTAKVAASMAPAPPLQEKPSAG